MQGLPIDILADVQTSAMSAPMAKKDFGIGLFLSDNIADLSATATPKLYYSYAEVLEDFTSTTEEAKAAAMWFGQKMRPRVFKIYTYDTTATPLVTNAASHALNADSDFHYVMASVNILSTDAIALQFLQWAHLNNKQGGFTTNDPLCKDSTDTTNIMYLAKAAKYNSFIQYSSSNDYAHVGAFAYASGVHLDAKDSSFTLHAKTIVGLISEQITTSQHAAIIGFNGTIYSTVNSLDMLLGSKLSSGDWFDSKLQSDYIDNAVAVELANLQIIKQKIGYDEDGMDEAKHRVEKVLIHGREMGFIAKNKIWRGSDFGAIKTGTLLPDGYYVYSDPVNEQSDVDVANRVAPYIYFCYTESGAIHKFRANGQRSN